MGLEIIHGLWEIRTVISLLLTRNAFIGMKVWFKSKKQKPWNKIPNIQLVVSPTRLTLSLRTHVIQEETNLVEYCLFYSTVIGSCFYTTLAIQKMDFWSK